MNNPNDEQYLKDEIARLERELNSARARLTQLQHPEEAINNESRTLAAPQSVEANATITTPHTLLLLSDSALPLGSFAFSSGLESYLAHHKPLPKTTTPIASFHHFLHLSISSLAGTTIPYILAAYCHPEDLETLDNDLDASTPCTVARRASIAQGRALLSVWERALKPTRPSNTIDIAIVALSTFSTSLKKSSASPPNPFAPNGHFAPLWSLVCRSMSVPLDQTAYVFLFNHAKTVLSAAVRASVMGPYQAQGVLASGWLQEEIKEALERNWDVKVENAGQSVPVLDLWVGRHELLYSRIFNS